MFIFLNPPTQIYPDDVNTVEAKHVHTKFQDKNGRFTKQNYSIRLGSNDMVYCFFEWEDAC
jgi:hypothetical protein